MHGVNLYQSLKTRQIGRKMYTHTHTHTIDGIKLLYEIKFKLN